LAEIQEPCCVFAPFTSLVFKPLLLQLCAKGLAHPQQGTHAANAQIVFIFTCGHLCAEA